MIKVRFFAAIKERVGKEELTLEIGEVTLEDLLNSLGREIPGFEALLRDLRVMVAVNHEMADTKTIIKDGDEVAFIPPFSGGAPHGTKEHVTQGFSLETNSNLKV